MLNFQKGKFLAKTTNQLMFSSRTTQKNEEAETIKITC